MKSKKIKEFTRWRIPRRSPIQLQNPTYLFTYLLTYVPPYTLIFFLAYILPSFLTYLPTCLPPPTFLLYLLMVTTRIERFLFSTRLCCSDLQWPLAANFCSLLTGKSQLVIAIICWAPWTSLVQSTGLRSMFLIVQPCIVLCDITKTLLIRKPLITFRPRIIKPQDPRDDGQRRVPRFFFSFSRMLRAMRSSR